MKFVKITEPYGEERWIDVEKVVMVRPEFDRNPNTPVHTVVGSAIFDVTGNITFSELKPDELMARMLAAKEGETA